MNFRLTPLIALSVVLALTGCQQKSAPDVLILPYSDFGPQVISYELLGMGFYSWDSQGHEDESYQYNIQVVVYDGPPAPVCAAYPTVKDKVDYRYVTRAEALRFLKQNIAACDAMHADDPHSGADDIAATLRATLRKIEKAGHQ